jgi:hypothetical protein
MWHWSESGSELLDDCLPVSPSWLRAPFGAYDQNRIYKLDHCVPNRYVSSSLRGRWVCLLKYFCLCIVFVRHVFSDQTRSLYWLLGLLNSYKLVNIYFKNVLVRTTLLSVIHGFTSRCFAIVFTRRCYVTTSINGDSSTSVPTPPPRQSQNQSYVTTDSQSASLSWCQAPIWGLRPDAGLLMWGALSDERTSLSFSPPSGCDFVTTTSARTA